MSDDEELQLAIEISKKTFKDEQKLRSNDLDLIRFESPDEPARQRKINQIKQLYEANSPGPSSYSGSLATSPIDFRPVYNEPRAGPIPHSQSYPRNYFQDWSAIASTSQPPAFPPPPRPPKPEQYKFPPAPSVPLLHDRYFVPPPPPVPPRHSRVQQSPPVPIHPTPPVSSTPLRHSAPSFASDSQQFLSPIKPFEISFNSTVDTSSNQTGSHDHSIQYQPLTHLYVPYVMHSLNSSYGALLNGDLIDLSAFEDSSNASQDEIRKEFDPLFISTYSTDTPSPDNSMPAVNAYFSKPIDEPECVGGAKLIQENIEFPSSSFCLIDCPNGIEEQVKKLCKRNLIRKDMTPDFFIAPTVDYMVTTASTVKVVVYKDHSWKANKSNGKAMICAIDEKMDIITTQALSLFDSELPTDKEYGLKIYGLNQFLSSDSLLGSNLYTGHCLLNGDDVKLDLGVFAPNSRIYEQTLESWNLMKSQVKYSTVVDKEDVENTLGHLASEMSQYEIAFNDGSTLKLSSSSQRVKQVIMLLCKCLHGIVPEKLYNEMQKYLASTTEDQLVHHRNDFLREIHSFLELYCRCTVSRYNIPPLQIITKPKVEVLSKMDFLQIMLNSVHSIPEHWQSQYSEFYMSLDLYHGTQVLDGFSNKVPKTIKNDHFFPRIPLDLYAKFKRLNLCQYPRETRIVVSISGTVRNSAQAANEYNPDIVMLGYCSVPLYDENLFMRQGPLFLPLTLLKKQPMLKPFGPYPYIKDARDPILIMSFKIWDTEIYFPNVVIDMQCIPQDFATLDIETQEYLLELIENQDTSTLETDDQDLIWQKRLHLTNQPEALPLVLSSLQDWSFGFVMRVYQILEEWAPLRPEIAMEFLLPKYPDERIRAHAVQSLARGSTDFLYHTIPQFIEALRFELYEKSALADFILELSFVSLDFTFEIYWQLQQRVDHCAVDDLPYAIRCQNLQQKMIDEHENPNLKTDIKLQHELLNELDSIQDDLRSKSGDSEIERLHRLRTRLGILDSKLLQNKVRLPICPAFDCTGVRIEECSVFNSNAKPLKIVFRGLNMNYSIIHKRDDDMRQDAFVMKMLNEMDRIWKSNGLDLRMITFRIMPVGYRRGMGELVLNCATLMEIQKEEGLRGVLNDEILRKWLMKHNSDEFAYKEAQENFIRSCAGWCIVTYVLGIGDRHNDNILFTKNGHVFHIDFGKYMGDWQMAAGFRRDRVPFVFTTEMFHVINNGRAPTQYNQKFIDYCCKAFNHLRRNKNTLTNLLRIMACSDIPGINMDSLAFVENNLMLDLSDTDATVQFTAMIQNSLGSAFVRLNFVAHTVAQFISSRPSFSKQDPNKLSFVPELYTENSDGRISRVTVLKFEKHCIPNKIYMYKVEVHRKNVAVSSFIYRSFAEFEELHTKLRARFPMMAVSLNTISNLRSNVRAVAQKRIIHVQKFLIYLFNQVDEICHCDLVYTFFHSILRDNKCDTYIDESLDMPSQCQIYLKIEYNSVKETLSVFIGHAKYLALLQNNQQPDPYVKTYVRPDLRNQSKQKTQVVRGTRHPTFNQDLNYTEFPIEILSTRVLEVSIWNNGGYLVKHKMYMLCIPLLKVKKLAESRKNCRTLEGWFNCEKCV
ncbi:Phosphatidylinositol 3-kinase piki-1 [Caenorhabditis elegans]|uniref:Phosphatidylinositol 3-kinase piki-1 n=1 Tax=Caenorhabditis elegans TaxID=6239 RepID=PIKI1_CAEEL|nr:Phosphatidylinositol 3-kinase piki-1 [Caenorhabditis elegans]G5EDY0.1 RecName: Full=Phosphatidylinositol 3-kinase piki-1; AltName: Full=Phosphoinositide-3-kinase class 2; Short=PI3-kinase class 2; Short=PI3K class 2 [Caenorhabditis elegans]CAA93489.1 Phosphatidylinositol 3-kinase piki-1 [Caenorhabditis elegans]|eukprot:NP_510529.1 Phosphatidylinositol 3-kinase piki-1 [Caenorhabditis elegans]